MSDFLFGSSSQSVQQLPLMTNAQMKLLDSMADTLRSQVGRGVSPYPGQTAPGETPIAREWFNQVANLTKGPLYQGMESTLLNTLRSFDPAATRAWWEEAVKAPALRTWEQDIAPSVMEQFAALDALDSGASRRALASAGQDLVANVNAKLADALYQAEQAHENRMLQAANLAGEVPLRYSAALSLPAQFQYGIAKDTLNEPYQKWLMSQPWNNPWLRQFFPTVMAAKPFENVVYSESQPGILGPLLQTGASLGSAYIMSPYSLW